MTFSKIEIGRLTPFPAYWLTPHEATKCKYCLLSVQVIPHKVTQKGGVF